MSDVTPRFKTYLLRGVLSAVLLALLWVLFRFGDAVRPAPDGAEGNLAASPSPATLGNAAVSSAGGTPERTAISDLVATEGPTADPAASEPRLLFGVLMNEKLEPIQDRWYAGVSLTGASGAREYASADKEGNYVFQDLEFGSYWVSAGAEGYRGLSERLEFLPETPHLRKDFVLAKAVALRIRLTTPDGADLFAALRDMEAPMGSRLLVPVATSEAPGLRFSEVTGSLNNHFGVGHFWNYGPRVQELPAGYWGILVLDGDLPAWVSLVQYHAVIASQRVEPGQEEVHFAIAPDALLAGLAALRIQLHDARDGFPIANATVMLQGGNSLPSMRTNEEGIAEIVDQGPGEYDARVFADGYERLDRSVELRPGETLDLGVMELEREVLVDGRMVDLDGNPRKESFAIGRLDEQSGSARWFRDASFQSGEDGFFKIRGLGRGEYLIRSRNLDAVNRRDHSGVTWVLGVSSLDARAAAVSGLEYRLQPAVRLVLRPDERLGAGARFRVRDGRGFDLVSSRFYGSDPRPLYLPSGEYRVLVMGQEQQVLMERSVTLSEREVVLELVLE